MTHKVNILLSTYNGSKYIGAQIESLICQSFNNLKIHIRDDGSTDGTSKIVASYVQSNKTIKFTIGKNIGVVKSFFSLLSDADETCEYYAFCDQDDIWKSEKVSRALSLISQHDSSLPLLYFSRVEYVDKDLRHISTSERPRLVGFPNALVENVATGCTIIINKTARDIILSSMPDFALMHDWWIYLVVSAFGKIIFDPEPTVLYRQHPKNLVGGSSNKISVNFKKISPFIRSISFKKKRTSDQVLEFKLKFSNTLSNEQLTIIDEFLNAKKNVLQRIKIVLSGRYKRQSKLDNLVFSLLIVFGYY